MGAPELNRSIDTSIGNQRIVFIGGSNAPSSTLILALARQGEDVDHVTCVEHLTGTCFGNGAGLTVVIELELHRPKSLCALEILRQRYPAARIVVRSPFPCLQTAVRAVRAGAAEFVCEPVTQAELIRAITGKQSVSSATPGQPSALPSLDRVEWDYITRVLDFTAGNISSAARILGVQRSTLQRRLKKLPAPR
jgi:two-component system, response regulator RegA